MKCVLVALRVDMEEGITRTEYQKVFMLLVMLSNNDVDGMSLWALWVMWHLKPDYI